MHDNMNTIRILFIGDVVGAAGRAIFQKHSARIKTAHKIDSIIVNGENSAHGRGITPRIVRFFKHNGADVITSGNHVWRFKEIYSYLSENRDLLRPANFPSSAPGVGVTTYIHDTHRIAIINLQGRVFMRDLIDCPFKTADSILTYLKDKTNLIFIDFHAEATSEKMALSYFLDGRVSGVVGTHTHIQTSDERVLPGGTAYITDLGMCGSLNSMLGMKKEPIIENFLTAVPVKFTPDTSLPLVLNGAWIEADVATGKAVQIQRVRIIDDQLYVGGEDD